MALLAPTRVPKQVHGSKVTFAMAKRKLKKNNTGHSYSVASVKPKSQKEMAQTEKSATFALAAVALVVAVCVAPLAAEISSCKYPELKESKSRRLLLPG